MGLAGVGCAQLGFNAIDQPLQLTAYALRAEFFATGVDFEAEVVKAFAVGDGGYAPGFGVFGEEGFEDGGADEEDAKWCGEEAGIEQGADALGHAYWVASFERGDQAKGGEHADGVGRSVQYVVDAIGGAARSKGDAACRIHCAIDSDVGIVDGGQRGIDTTERIAGLEGVVQVVKAQDACADLGSCS